MLTNFEKAFHKMKADVQVKEGPRKVTVNRRGARRVVRERNSDSYTVNVVKGKFVFDLGTSKAIVQVQEADAKDKHVLVNVRREEETSRTGRNGGVVTEKVTTNEKWLCGHDERDWFVAAVGSECVNIWEAKQSLKPPVIKAKELALKPKERQKRKNDVYLRQGEWFFVPADPRMIPVNPVIHKDEPMSRGAGSKPHIVEECFRMGGTSVWAKGTRILTDKEYKLLDSKEQHGFMSRTANATVFVRGYVKHPDHDTLYLKEWHSIMMNEEKRSKALVFLD